MAFCNSCGSTLEPSQKFCPKCGAANPGSSASAASSAQPIGAQGASGTKIIVIAVAVIVGLMILGMGVASLIAWQIARHSHVETSGENVKVETPFGTVETSRNAEDAARNLGVDVYPGAKALKDNAGTVTMGNMTTTDAEFETSDPVDKVADFYKQHYPNANVTHAEDEYTIVSTSKDSAITINIKPRQGTTHIVIANISGLPMGKHP